MLKRITRIVVGLTALLFAGAGAQAASTTLSIIINGPASATVSCPLAASYNAPMAAGANICNIAVSPSTWSGALALSGPDAASFALSGQSLVVGPNGLGAGNYSLTITATP